MRRAPRHNRAAATAYIALCAKRSLYHKHTQQKQRNTAEQRQIQFFTAGGFDFGFFGNNALYV